LLLAPSTRAQPLVAFDPPTYLSAGSFPASVAVSDSNGDDDPDLAVANRFSSDVSVLLGGGAGGFTGPTDFAAGSPYVVAVADFNADGKPDLTTTHPTTNNVAVLLNTTVTNRAPTATADAYGTAEDTPLTVAAPGVLANDSDPDNNPLSAVLVSGPSHGTLTLNPDGSFTYTPATNHTGSDSFTYQASDGTLASELATVILTVTAVNDTPTATVAAGGTGPSVPVAHINLAEFAGKLGLGRVSSGPSPIHPARTSVGFRYWSE
jgi:VCBS repeat-containing protein